MDGWLKVLVATACLVIISGGGYYGWTEYRAANVRSAIAERLDAERAQARHLTSNNCNDIAKRAIRDGAGQLTEDIVQQLYACDDRNLIGTYAREQLDFNGVF